jgi:hypothetical protein
MSDEEHATPRWEARPLEEQDTPNREPRPPAEPDSGEEGFWSAYWERFRRQQVDDPVDERREGMWDRFRRQDVDAPVRGART